MGDGKTLAVISERGTRMKKWKDLGVHNCVLYAHGCHQQLRGEGGWSFGMEHVTAGQHCPAPKATKAKKKAE